MDSSEAEPSLVSRPVAAAAPIKQVATASSTAPPPPVLAPNPPPNGNEIAIPLAPIITGLPPELRGKIVAVPPAFAINLPIETITAQLAFGVVKISFGELRQLAPAAFVNSGGEHDSKMVSLPLAEILPRLNPALLARRTGPKVEVSNDVNGPFGGRGAGVAFTTQPLKAPTTTPAPIPAPEPASVPLRMNPPVVAPIGTPAPIAFTPPPVQRVVPPAPQVTPIRPASPVSAIPTITAAPAPAFATPRSEPLQPTVFASLWDLAEHWPEELKDEISQTSLANVSVPLAGNLVEAGLKRGRVTMAWKQLRILAKPSSPPSQNDNVELDLPLKVIAPLFFAAQKNLQGARQKTAVAPEIPDLFFGFPQAAPEVPVKLTAPAEKKSTDSNFFVKSERSAELNVVENTFAPPPVPQTDFTHRFASPKDVVTRAIALPGVVGAVVTLPDGLRVASQVPVEFSADTLAAFIPQIFERMNQSAKELRMGALNNVSFTVGNVPWQIFRVNAVYFAAFGRSGEPLPATQLAVLSGELDRKRTQ